MNFYNPYFYSVPSSTSTGLLSKLSFSSIINGTTKTLNLVNQTIPLVKQVSPIIKNAKTMFNVMNEFKKAEPTTTNKKSIPDSNILIDSKSNTVNETKSNYPTFFV